MKTVYIFGISIVVAVLVGFLFVSVYSAQQPAVLIVVDDEGFLPAEVSVAQGAVVRFENRGSDWYWPASNSHPTHELYSTFDPREPIAPGDSWDFVATEEGHWGFHDHLRPNIRGVLHVLSNQ